MIAFLSAIKDGLMSFKKKKPIDEEMSLEELQQPIRQEIKKPSEKNGNLLHTKLPQVHGIKKKLTIGSLILFAIIFLATFLFSAKYNTKSKNPTMDSTHLETGEQNANPIAKQMPRTYSESDLAKYNNKAGQPNQPGQLNQNGQMMNAANLQNSYSAPINGNQGYAYSQGGQRPVTLPNYSNPGGYYPSQFVDPQSQMQKGMMNIVKSDVEDYLKSPIGFAIAAAANAVNAAGINTNQPNTSNAAIASSYEQPEPYVLQQGAIIPVLLITGIDSDRPGQVVAQVRENVYDSVTGQYVLIPQGTRILGNVSADKVGTGQERIGVSWQRMLLPNGVSVDIGNMDGVDMSGYSGLTDQVDNHTGKIIGATLLSSMLSAAAQIASGNTGDTSSQSASQLAVSGAATSIMTAGSKILDKQININPTIKIRSGLPFNVFVNKDVILRPYYG